VVILILFQPAFLRVVLQVLQTGEHTPEMEAATEANLAVWVAAVLVGILALEVMGDPTMLLELLAVVVVVAAAAAETLVASIQVPIMPALDLVVVEVAV
jgi:hypothetical protein